MNAAASPGRRGRTGRAAASAGFTLVEVLVATGLTAVLATAVLATVRGSARAGELVGTRAEAGQVAPLTTALLRFEIERAGRTLDEGGLRLVLDAAEEGGDVLEVQYLAEAHRAEPVQVDASFFAAADSRGRPNLYRRPRGGRKQPWLLGVTGVHVAAAIDEDGNEVQRAALPGSRRWAGLVVEVRFEDGHHRRFTADTARAGLVESVVAP